ncbi:hypothetical protein [Sphingomonas solaris]|uniref:Glycosyltransferase family 2 protein n=1 Tax=Alterirhizorhabdus solaris TaxID=2529389 RepID=A0A558R2R8_9SPHN|nr:hypothetical protein [Sphingomonas solaris]TVV73679.1 hypothetical protein FOY91_11530 [Sphingomonas solaris]
MTDTIRPHPLLADPFGLATNLRDVDPVRARTIDRDLDFALTRFDWRPLFRASPPQRITVLIPAYPLSADARKTLHGRTRIACGSRHDVRIVIDDRVGVSRWDKVTAIMADGGKRDWLLVIDDDAALGAQFLDRFVAAIMATSLDIAQPAHRMHSYASYAVTQRRSGSIVRRSHFVEGGPVLAIRATLLPSLTPVPRSRWGWGVDIVWADLALRNGWRLGIVDGAPVEHLRPINFDLPDRRPLLEASALLHARQPAIDRKTMLGGDRILVGY